jgi:hypothetical protein
MTTDRVASDAVDDDDGELILRDELVLRQLMIQLTA